MAIKYVWGICSNTDMDGEGNPCPLCRSKERQRLLETEPFECAKCHEPLTKVPAPKTFMQKWGAAVIAAAVIALGGAVFVALNSLKKDAEIVTANPGGSAIDSTDVTGTPGGVETVQEEGRKGVEKPVEPKKKPVTVSAGPRLDWGTYSGPSDGMNGRITVTRNYSLPLRNAAHDVIELVPGDVIVDTQFRDGDLISGRLIHGTQERYFSR